jgi:hypothetical protein
MNLKDVLHFDPVTIAVILAGFIGTWYTLRSDSKWHSEWIKTHDKECDENKRQTAAILAELTQIAKDHGGRLDRVERHLDREDR